MRSLLLVAALAGSPLAQAGPESPAGSHPPAPDPPSADDADPAAAAPAAPAVGGSADAGAAPAARSPAQAVAADPSVEGAGQPGVEAGLEQAVDRYQTTPWVLQATQYVRSAPRGGADRLGLLLKGSVVSAVGPVEAGDRSCAAGWVPLVGDAWLCARWAEPAEDPSAEPVPLPQRVPFDAPEPDEYRSYVETGAYAVDDVADGDGLVPFVYGKAWRRWTAPTWRSQWAYEHHRGSEGALESDRKFAFTGRVETSRGPVFVRSDGAVVPADQVFLYPITRFHGRDLTVDPVPAGWLAGWVTPYDGAVLRGSADPEGAPVGELAFQDPVDARPAPDQPGWLEIRGAVGDGDARYLPADQVATWETVAPAPDLRPGELWIDLELGEQVLAVMEGDQPIFVTLVSSGRDDKRKGTPTGLYRTTDKAAWGDMNNREGADDVYYVEKVPWILHFWPRYALHGAFWHWGMGHQASHGCVNLAPRDAAWIFERVGPVLPDGWHTVYATAANPGATLRVRRGADLDLRDRRVLPGADQARR